VDIVTWLKLIGLPQYESAFREAAIDGDVLPELTDTDLEKLGVVLGHRKRMLKAIGDLKSVGPASLRTDVGAKATSEGPLNVSPTDTAERRQVNVLFSALS
jgi:hypothetical protein